jgi:hypothetical protein
MGKRLHLDLQQIVSTAIKNGRQKGKECFVNQSVNQFEIRIELRN